MFFKSSEAAVHHSPALPRTESKGSARNRPGSCQALNKPTQFLQLTMQSSQFELRAPPVTGWKSQMLREWPQLLPIPCSVREISRQHHSTMEMFCSHHVLPSHGGQAGWEPQERGRGLRRDLLRYLTLPTALQILEEPAAAVQTRTEQSTHLFVLKPFMLRGCD